MHHCNYATISHLSLNCCMKQNVLWLSVKRSFFVGTAMSLQLPRTDKPNTGSREGSFCIFQEVETRANLLPANCNLSQEGNISKKQHVILITSRIANKQINNQNNKNIKQNKQSPFHTFTATPRGAVCVNTNVCIISPYFTMPASLSTIPVSHMWQSTQLSRVNSQRVSRQVDNA